MDAARPEFPLLPPPREITRVSDHRVAVRPMRLSSAVPPDTAAAAMRVLQPLIGDAPDHPPLMLSLRINPSVTPPQGYALYVTATGIDLIAADAAGLFYGAHTLRQLLAINPREIPCLSVRDWPDYALRGVMLDISRDKVPTMATLKALIDRLASWKINQLQLYMEHTFAYRDHADVWKNASPLSAGEVRELDTFCRERLIDLAPNQNSFGHMERWLKHERYRDLAEAPDGSDTPWGFRWQGPFSLCPTDPRSLQFLDGLYGELLPNFSSKLFNVGLDETFDLGQGRSKAACDERGVERVYLDFLLQVHGLAKKHGRTMQFWGDIIIKRPQLIPELPKDAIALHWGYEADHPFDAELAQFKSAGVPFYVCPGTSSWCSIAGRTENALGNLRNAAAMGLKHGAIGFLNTDWGDYGHLQYLPISYLPLAAGAGLSWCEEASRSKDFTQEASRFAFDDPTGKAGCLAYDFGNLYQTVGRLVPNASALFRVLVPQPSGKDAAAELTPDGIASTERALDHIEQRIDATGMAGPEAELIRAEFHNAVAMLSLACRLARREQIDPNSLNAIIAEHRRLWLARNRPCGLDDSAARLEKHRP